MTEILEFKTFCIEAYKIAHKLKGKEVIELFEKYDVFNYINSFYDVLHTFGDKYIVEDIDTYINNRIKS